MSAGSAFLEEQGPSFAELDDLRPLASHVSGIGRGHAFHSSRQRGDTGAKFKFSPCAFEVREGNTVSHFDFNSVDPKRGAICVLHTPTLPATPSREVNHDSHMLGSEFVAALQRVTPRAAYISGLDARKAAVGSAVASSLCRNAGYHSNWLYLASAIAAEQAAVA